MYEVNGEKRYSLKDKIAYHTACANTGKNIATGEKLSFASQVRHANSATRCVNKLNSFMKQGQRFNDMKKNYNHCKK